MATLSEKINKNKSILKQSQGLFETTGESLMSRIRDRGLAPGAGTSPLAASGLGVGPDVAKMAGTGAQMDRAIRESISPDKRPREPQARMFLTEEEQQEKQKAQQLSNLDRLGERIGTIVNQAVSSAQVTNVFRVDVQEDIVKSTYPDLTEEQRNNFQQILAEITYDENGQPQITEDIVGRLNASLPADATPLTEESVKPFITSGQLQFNKTKAKDTYPDITDEQLTALEKIVAADDFDADKIKKDELNIVAEILGIDKNNLDEIIGKIKELITPISDTVVDNITSTLGPAVSLSSLTAEDWKAFGLGSAQDLGNLIGLESDEIQDMTIGDLQKRIDALMMADYDRVDELTRVANDPFYPEALRKAAKAELRDLSSVGVIATESDFAKLNEAVQSADELEIAGKTYTTEELLSDENLTVMIATYLEDPESDYSKDLLKDFPALAEFIDSNKAALDNAMKYLDESIKDKIAISKENDKMNSYTPVDGMAVDLSDINEDLIEDYDSDVLFRDEAITPNSSTHLENIYGTDSVFNDAQKGVYVSLLRQAKDNKYPELLKEFGSLTSGQIADNAKIYGISSEQWMQRRYQQYVNADIIDKALTEDATPEQAQQALTSLLGTTAEGLDEFVTAYGVLVEYSFGTVSPEMTRLKNSVVLTKDGKIDYKATIAKFKDINADNNLLFKQTNLGDWAKNQTTSLKAQKYSDLFNAMKDGVLSLTEIDNILKLPDDAQISRLVEIAYDKQPADAGGIIYSMGGNTLFSTINKFVDDKFKTYLKDIFKDTQIDNLMNIYGTSKPIQATWDNKDRMTAYRETLLREVSKLQSSGGPRYLVLKFNKIINQLKKNIDKISTEAEKHRKKDYEKTSAAWDDYEAEQRGGVD
jgi:hypothetical protein